MTKIDMDDLLFIQLFIFIVKWIPNEVNKIRVSSQQKNGWIGLGERKISIFLQIRINNFILINHRFGTL
jgi:hypothetical protein